ncbi:phosphoglycerate dehydrogenase [Xanthobacter sp. V2C-8]|uniref:phosphoglycerate dehydrogenase n=1 Tax=Xanthobacter albus TaxID=3119929 RepID=UPI00372B1C15
MAPRVLISDPLSPAAIRIFEDRGIAADLRPELGPDKAALAAAIGGYDGLVVRSGTRVTPKVLARAGRLKVIGRAGTGVDNIDLPAATARGVVVMNTPFGNSITTAEHAIALMFALARQIPAADASTQAGRWEKDRFMGVELTGKTLGVIGCGNIGSIVAERALGLRMKVIAFDPFLSVDRALALGVEKVELDALLARADFISLHTPLTEKTRNILSALNIARAKAGVRIINCSRGGLLDEAALAAALDSGHVAGAALDVFQDEPALASPLFGRENVVCTPHLGAATTEAQENVALQIAGQMSDYLLSGAVANALNFPSITAEEAPRLRPHLALAERLGAFLGQLTDTDIGTVRVTFEGAVAGLNVKALTAAAVAGLLRPMLQEVNLVSAPALARARGVNIEETTRAAAGDYESLVTLSVIAGGAVRTVCGTVFADGHPRIVAVNGIKVDAAFAPAMIYAENIDKPGFVGQLASLLGAAGVNIATFSLGRDRAGGDAIALVAVDGSLPAGLMDAARALPQVRLARLLAF